MDCRAHRPLPLLVTLFVALLPALLPGLLRAQQRTGESGAPPSIEQRTAGMQKLDGYFPLYWEESSGRLWLEIGRWDTDVLHMTGLAAGLGSNDIGLDRGQLAGSRVVRFQRVGPKVLMVQPNLDFRASSSDAAEVRAVTDAFAPSTLWGFTVAAATGDRVLVDATDFLVRDVNNTSQRLRPGTYRLDASRSAVFRPMTLNFPENTEMEVSLTYVQQPGGGGGGGFGGGGDADGFQGVGDVAASAEAATIRVHHSLVRLPELGSYTPRIYDPRSGFGSVSWEDYSAPLGEPMTQRFIRRHRLEKRTPGAAPSAPVEPIVYYLDPGTPEPIRSALLEGGRWWNQAFEAAGFIDGFRMELLPEGVSTHDIRYNVVNWVHRSTRGWSTGGSVTDPRTGEILKGVVTLGSLRIRQDYMIAEGLLAPYTNGDETPSELAEWALARIRQLSAHEIGHTLGLGHNYYDSEAGRISVMDYPHPLITLANGRLDPSQVYDTDIGEWDKVAITYGYAEFGPGTDEQARLRSILDEAMAQDVLYMTNQDTEAHGRVDQWSNGTDGAAELERMMDVRRFALDRFGERALPGGRPLAQLEEVLVPLYLHHRYQVEAAASMLGGLHYGYAMRGDGRDPVAWVDGRQQRAALAALLRTIRPGELALPRPVLERIPPRPPGYGRTRELFPRWTGSAFDALSPAAVAADHTIAQMLDPERAARLVEQSVVDPSLPSLGEVIAALVGATDGGGAASPYEAEIQRTVQRVLAERLMALAEGAPMPQVRAEASAQLERMQHRMERATETLAEGEGNAIDADAAHRRLLARDIERVLDRPAEPWALPRPAEAPPGAPIGDPALDWLGTGGGGWWERLGPSGLRPGMGWLQQVAPACTLEEVFP